MNQNSCILLVINCKSFHVRFGNLSFITIIAKEITTSFNIWIKIEQLDVTCFIISLFNAQHVSDVNTSILRSLRLIYKSQAPEDVCINIRNMLSIK